MASGVLVLDDGSGPRVAAHGTCRVCGWAGWALWDGAEVGLERRGGEWAYDEHADAACPVCGLRECGLVYGVPDDDRAAGSGGEPGPVPADLRTRAARPGRVS